MDKDFTQYIESWAELTVHEIIEIVTHKYKSGAIDNDSYLPDKVGKLVRIYYIDALQEIIDKKSQGVQADPDFINLQKF